MSRQTRRWKGLRPIIRVTRAPVTRHGAIDAEAAPWEQRLDPAAVPQNPIVNPSSTRRIAWAPSGWPNNGDPRTPE